MCIQPPAEAETALTRLLGPEELVLLALPLVRLTHAACAAGALAGQASW